MHRPQRYRNLVAAGLHTAEIPAVCAFPSPPKSLATTSVSFIRFGRFTLMRSAPPYDVVFALDARTGAERWHFDPKLGELFGDGGMVTSRGVALWQLGAVSESSDCARRVFLATLDARLLAIDASTGHLCSGFGNNGSIDLRSGVHFQGLGYYGMTSPPTVVGNVVVVGSSIIDFKQVDIESGLVRGYDAVNGKLLWSWEPLPWAEKQPVRTGGGNTWSVISADPELGFVYLPTGAASPDYYGGMRPGDDRDANSIVALDAATGKKVWSFQTVHHDLWDYDIAAEPVLFTWRGNTPAVAVTTKMGMIFLFDRRTGQPLVPVEERPVPQSDVPGEKTSPTQPFQNIPTLSPLTMNLSDFRATSVLLVKLIYAANSLPVYVTTASTRRPAFKAVLNILGPSVASHGEELPSIPTPAFFMRTPTVTPSPFAKSRAMASSRP